MPKSRNDSEELSEEVVDAAKKKSRWSALILAIIFLLIAVLPPAWAAYAPLLFILPIVYSLLSRLRSRAEAPDASAGKIPGGAKSLPVEPYSKEPRDPMDPRRYRPID